MHEEKVRLVDSQIQQLMEMVKEEYAGYMKICLIAESDAIKFYETCGFKKVETAKPMYFLG